MTIYRTTSQWSGFNGAPGYTNFFFQGTGQGDSAAAVVAKTHAFWTALPMCLPTVVDIQVSGEVAEIDEVSGMVQSFINVTEPAVVGGQGAGAFSGPSGACIGWTTGGVRNGRRVRGRTFIVPMSGANYEADGTILAARLEDLRGAANALSADDGTNLMVWCRPSSSGASDGVAHFVTGYRVQDKVAVLRSRRD